MENNRNFFITIALSVLILTLWQVFYMNPRIEAAARGGPHRGRARRSRAEGAADSRPPPGRRSRQLPAAPQASRSRRAGDAAAAANREQALAATPARQDRHAEPCRLDQPDRRAHRRSQPQALPRDRRPNSPIIELLNPQALPNGYFAEIGFVGSDATGAVARPRHGLDGREATRR